MAATDAAAAARLRIELCDSPGPRQVRVWVLEVPGDALVGDALRAAGWQSAGGPDWGDEPSVGVWGRRQSLSTPLHDGDRVEIYRELRVDPKFARRERFERQGARSAGLFARRKPGAKPGY